jgi:hypothetical protein
MTEYLSFALRHRYCDADTLDEFESYEPFQQRQIVRKLACDDLDGPLREGVPWQTADMSAEDAMELVDRLSETRGHPLANVPGSYQAQDLEEAADADAPTPLEAAIAFRKVPQHDPRVQLADGTVYQDIDECLAEATQRHMTPEARGVWALREADITTREPGNGGGSAPFSSASTVRPLREHALRPVKEATAASSAGALERGGPHETLQRLDETLAPDHPDREELDAIKAKGAALNAADQLAITRLATKHGLGLADLGTSKGRPSTKTAPMAGLGSSEGRPERPQPLDDITSSSVGDDDLPMNEASQAQYRSLYRRPGDDEEVIDTRDGLTAEAALVSCGVSLR